MAIARPVYRSLFVRRCAISGRCSTDPVYRFSVDWAGFSTSSEQLSRRGKYRFHHHDDQRARFLAHWRHPRTRARRHRHRIPRGLSGRYNGVVIATCRGRGEVGRRDFVVVVVVVPLWCRVVAEQVCVCRVG